MNGHPTALSLSFGALMLIAGSVADGFNSVVGPIGGGAAAVGALFAAYELSYRDEPDWARAAGVGGVVGAILGAVTVLVDSFVGG